MTILMTIGDPAGIGPEVAVKACRAERCVMVGDGALISEAASLIGRGIDLRRIARPVEAVFDGSLNYIDCPVITTRGFTKGASSREGGVASAAYIKKAVGLILNGEAHALVTAPITKESLKLAGVDFPGHTEMLASLTGCDNYAMMLCGGGLRVMLVTIHTSIASVPSLITKDRVLKTIRLANEAGTMLAGRHPRLAVAGLNPHAGESGMFGSEEINEIVPAVGAARSEGIDAIGPLPPDTLFYKAYKGMFDVVVVMYHDQGLIPLKMIAFEKGVNTTVGLPIIRTSPDHGTAYDIAWKGVADPSSMLEAVKMAQTMVNNKFGQKP